MRKDYKLEFDCKNFLFYSMYMKEWVRFMIALESILGITKCGLYRGEL